MVHFLKQLVDSIYRPAYWYQLILHWAANCLPAGTVGCTCVCVVLRKVWAEMMARKARIYLNDQYVEEEFLPLFYANV